MDYICAKFGDFSFSRFGFIVRTDRITDRLAERERERVKHIHRGGSTLYSRSSRDYCRCENKKDGYRQQNVRQRQKLISIIDYDVCMTFY